MKSAFAIIRDDNLYYVGGNAWAPYESAAKLFPNEHKARLRLETLPAHVRIKCDIDMIYGVSADEHKEKVASR